MKVTYQPMDYSQPVTEEQVQEQYRLLSEDTGLLATIQNLSVTRLRMLAMGIVMQVKSVLELPILFQTLPVDASGAMLKKVMIDLVIDPERIAEYAEEQRRMESRLIRKMQATHN